MIAQDMCEQVKGVEGGVSCLIDRHHTVIKVRQELAVDCGGNIDIMDGVRRGGLNPLFRKGGYAIR
jgi:hypothetical protein